MGEKTIMAAEALFIRRWGEMAARWGVSRTMAEIHALLYLAREPLCTDDVMDRLAVSRGSASVNLRELVNWGLIYRVHQRGDRKEYFEAEKDVWQMFEIIIRERRRREVQPIVETTQKCLSMATEAVKGFRGEARTEAHEAVRRFTDILEFCDAMNTLFLVVGKAGHAGLKPLARTLHKLVG